MSQVKPDIHRPEFPRANAYDPDWVLKNQMGPNALWLAEWLAQEMDLRPGMRVLDLGCGTAMTSIFLAREFDVRVWATDLWVHPDDNWRRITDAKVGDRVCPIQAEAHALPYAVGYFDAIVSVDAYHYFGTDDLYLGYVSRLLRPGGRVGIAVPGLMQPFENGVPEHLRRKQSNGHAFWVDDCMCFRAAEWWRAHWEQSGCIDVALVDTLPDGWKVWRDFEAALDQAGMNKFPSVVETLDEDGGRYIGFVRAVGIRRPGDALPNLYDPALIPRMQSHG